ncbi:MAG: VRR-NUC domain-containing protein [Actinomycetota bacterium]|jgi:hypothetical protein|nr:VRR-NUC domain-containing protein [Actinomycetota bacterium]
MSEKELYAEVQSCCDRLLLWTYHSHDARRDVKGWPDLVIWGPGGMLFRELKSERGRSSRAQLEIMTSLRLAGQDAAIWRPKDLDAGVVGRELFALTRPTPLT